MYDTAGCRRLEGSGVDRAVPVASVQHPESEQIINDILGRARE